MYHRASQTSQNLEKELAIAAQNDALAQEIIANCLKKPVVPVHHQKSNLAKNCGATTPKTVTTLKPTTTGLSNANIKKDLTNTKRTRNLNLAKEKLYEMKKTIDAKVILDKSEVLAKAAAPTPIAVNTAAVAYRSGKSAAPPMASNLNPTSTRTTPRKVKKRSGERSFTAGLVLENEFEIKERAAMRTKSKENLEYVQQFTGNGAGMGYSSNAFGSTKSVVSAVKQQNMSGNQSPRQVDLFF